MSTSVVKCGEGLRNKVFIIIRRYIDHMRFAAYMAVLTHFFIFFWFYFVSMYILLNVLYGSV